MNFKPKLKPEDLLANLVSRVKDGLPRVHVLAVFGSWARGNYRPGKSDLNILVLCDQVDLTFLKAWETKISNVDRSTPFRPIFIATEELSSYANIFPIEFLDMQDHYKILFGEDVIAGLTIFTADLRIQTLHDLGVHVLKLRDQLAKNSSDPHKLVEIVSESLPSTLSLLRAALRLTDKTGGMTKEQSAVTYASRLGFDAHLIERLTSLHLRRKTDDVSAITQQYLDLLHHALKALAAI